MTHKEYKELLAKIDKQVKETNGHNYLTILKTKCQNCGRTQKQKGMCPAWLNYFMNLLEEEFMKLGIVSKAEA